MPQHGISYYTLREDNMEEISLKTGRSMEELQQKFEEAGAEGKLYRFTVWEYNKKVGEE